MKSKRKTMLVAALAVAVIALAGIGYAVASGYTAKTESTDNNLDTAKYNLISLNNYGSFMKTDLSFDTETTSSGTTYDFHGKTAKYVASGEVYNIDGSATAEEYNAIAVSDALSVTVNTTNGGPGTLTLEITDAFNITGIDFIVAINGATTNVKKMTAFSTAQSIMEVTTNTVVTVQVFAVVTSEFVWNPASCQDTAFKFVLTAS